MFSMFPHPRPCPPTQPPSNPKFNIQNPKFSHPLTSHFSGFSHPRFRRDRLTFERGAGACLRDFTLAAAQPDFTIRAHLEKLAKPPQAPQENRESNTYAHFLHFPLSSYQISRFSFGVPFAVQMLISGQSRWKPIT